MRTGLVIAQVAADGLQRILLPSASSTAILQPAAVHAQ